MVGGTRWQATHMGDGRAGKVLLGRYERVAQEQKIGGGFPQINK